MATQQSSSSISEGEARPIDIGLAPIFDYEQLQHATNYFNPSEVIGEGGYGVVYRGELTDGRAVAVKQLSVCNKKRNEQFLNEARLLSRLRHNNLVTLYGCTDPQDEKLLLVYEFVPNGTVADHLHRRRLSKDALTWAQRMQIAIETAEALVYLHSLQPPIIHRDVKTDNILLDDNFSVKVADFGMCRLLPLQGAHVSTMPQGTQGYTDPEYYQSYKLTAMSDVFSFGVVLVELISGKAALDVEREDDEIWLVRMFFNTMKNKKLEKLVDLEIGYSEDSEVIRMVDSVAKLAYKCLQPRGYKRPRMMEILLDLKRVRDNGDQLAKTERPLKPQNPTRQLLAPAVRLKAQLADAVWREPHSKIQQRQPSREELLSEVMRLEIQKENILKLNPWAEQRQLDREEKLASVVRIKANIAEQKAQLAHAVRLKAQLADAVWREPHSKIQQRQPSREDLWFHQKRRREDLWSEVMQLSREELLAEIERLEIQRKNGPL